MKLSLFQSYLYIAALGLFLPGVAAAQNAGIGCPLGTPNCSNNPPPTTTPTDFASLVQLVVGLINLLIPAIFGVVFVFFVWKIIDAWILNAGDERKVAEGKQYVLWAILLFALMVSTWGIVALLQSSFF
ncbi:hypothetical protein KC887_07120 [Candidatus Kaiserbacteria bacterium]|nr:hypothetical protein [Candidatus Kaiserbacteria bacterium]